MGLIDGRKGGKGGRKERVEGKLSTTHKNRIYTIIK